MADESKADPKIEYAKLAERAERYEDMAKVIYAHASFSIKCVTLCVCTIPQDHSIATGRVHYS